MSYKPKPIELADVKLPDELIELREAIAENAHEIWAQKRQADGWRFGPERDDKLKQTPDMVKYEDLSDEEKEYDREMAMQTLKLMLKIGYDIVKREDTELYRVLLGRIANAKQTFYCPHCKKDGKMTPIYKHQVFCDKCGTKIEIDWSLYD